MDVSLYIRFLKLRCSYCISAKFPAPLTILHAHARTHTHFMLTQTHTTHKHNTTPHTLLIHYKIKPDGVQRGLVGDIISRFERRGYQLCGLKTKLATKELLQQHYKDLVDKPFFPKLQQYMLSGPVVCMIWQGKEAVATGRLMLGATNPLQSNPGTIRGDYCIEGT